MVFSSSRGEKISPRVILNPGFNDFLFFFFFFPPPINGYSILLSVIFFLDDSSSIEFIDQDSSEIESHRTTLDSMLERSCNQRLTFDTIDSTWLDELQIIPRDSLSRGIENPST